MFLNNLGVALAFLSRLGQAKCLNKETLTASVPYFGFVGLLLGLLLSASSFLVLNVSGEQDFCFLLLASWLWLILEIWLTRGLHWDGLADLGDALGSGASGEKFWTILKDSRLGTFGALTLLTVFLGQWLCISCQIRLGHWCELILAPAWARAVFIWPAFVISAHPSSVLGQIVCDGTSLKSYLVSLLCVGAVLFFLFVWRENFSFLQAVFLVALQYLLNKFITASARRQGGLSGDFFGATIELSQLGFLFATL